MKSNRYTFQTQLVPLRVGTGGTARPRVHLCLADAAVRAARAAAAAAAALTVGKYV
jgi:hypothetical protein